MATAVSFTADKIYELMQGWEGVSAEQTAQATQLAIYKGIVDTQAANFDEWNTITYPQITEDLANSALSVAELTGTTIPDLQARLDQNDLDWIDNASALGALDTQLNSNSDWILEFNSTTVPDLLTRLEANEDALAALDLSGITADISALEALFPVTGANIAANTILTNNIGAGQITAVKIATGTITALQIAAGTITTAEIAAGTITAADIATGTITALQIAGLTITGAQIAAGTITATKIAAGTITAVEIATDTITASQIAAGAITTSELATNSVTAIKIAAGEITGDKIAANTISVSKLIVSDLTNLVVDGDLSDSTLATWELGTPTPYIIRTDPVGDVPYLEVSTDPSRVSYIKNRNIIESAIGQEFYLTMEVWTPNTNVNTLTFTPAIEGFDVDGTGGTFKLGTAVTVAPNTGWTMVQSTVVMDVDTLPSARFSPFVAVTATANQKLRIRKITMRRRAGGELILDGSITAQQLDVESISAAVIGTGVIQSQLSITGLLSIADTNQNWSAEGLNVGEDIILYPDGRTSQYTGDIITSNISIKDGLSVGGEGEISGIVVATNGVATPTARMALGQTWPTARPSFVQAGDGSTDKSTQWNDICEYDSTRWIVAMSDNTAGFRLVLKSDLSSPGTLTVGGWADKFEIVGGICLHSGSLYIVGSDKNRSGDTYIYKVSSTSTVVKQAEFKLGSNSFANGKRMRLISNGTNVGLVFVNATAEELQIRWFNTNLTAQVGSNVTLMTGVPAANVGGAYYGPLSSGGADRIAVSLFLGDSALIRVWNSTGSTQQTSENWPRAFSASLCGLVYDSGQGRMLSYDKYINFYTYSLYTSGGTLNGQYTNYDGDNSVYPSGTIIGGVDKSGLASGFHETSPSPVTSFALDRRAWPVITAPPAVDELVTDPDLVDKANQIGIYASVGSTPRLQGYLGVGERTLPITDALSTSGAVAGSSGVASFATAMVPTPGRLKSTAETAGSSTWELPGSGAGRVGPFSWDTLGRPLVFGTWNTNASANLADNTWTTRGGWSQIDSTNFPTNGITVASGVFTVSKRGLYLLQGVITIAGATARARREGRIWKNNTSSIWHFESPTHTTGTVNLNSFAIPFAALVPLEAGDTLEFQGLQNTGGAIAWDTTLSGNTVSIACLFAMP